MNKTGLTVGIDIGGTNTVYGFVDKAGNCIFESSIPTYSHQSAAELFCRLLPEIKKKFNELEERYTLNGIGVGAPNANYYKGTVENPPNLKWGVVNIAEIIKSDFDLPVAVTNDANACAIGEMLFGAARGMTDFIVITLGTGLGSGIVVNGNLLYGSDGFAGEIGHTIYDVNGRSCGCGRKGCLETYASATGIKNTVIELLNNSTAESVLRYPDPAELNAKMISDAAMHGDQVAREAFEFTGKVLGLKLADAVAHTSPQAIILFGGLALAGDLIVKPTKKYMEMNLFHVFKNKVDILLSGLPLGNSAVLGASALIWNEIGKKENPVNI